MTKFHHHLHIHSSLQAIRNFLYLTDILLQQHQPNNNIHHHVIGKVIYNNTIHGTRRYRLEITATCAGTHVMLFLQYFMSDPVRNQPTPFSSARRSLYINGRIPLLYRLSVCYHKINNNRITTADEQQKNNNSRSTTAD